jgi:alpha-glucosidase
MKLRCVKKVFWLAFFLPFMTVAASQKTGSWSLASPNGKCRITVFLDGEGKLDYAVDRDSQPVIEKSPLGLRRDDQDFERGLVFEHASPVEQSREKYELMSGNVTRVDHILNHRRLRFYNGNSSPIVIELTASDEGVAFRYNFPNHAGETHVLQNELTGFAVPPGTRGWLQPYHAASDYTPAYEDFYFHVAPGDPLPKHARAKPLGWAFPALLNISKQAGWVLLTESGTDGSFCACHLGADSSGGRYRIAFPFANEATKHQTNIVGPEPRWTLPWTMPWRVMVLGQTAGDIAMSTLVTDLAPPSKIADTSWIHPGRASWAWWSFPEGPATKEHFDHFTDFAAKMGWEYTLFDAGWWNPGLKNISDYALSENVKPLAWLHAEDFYTLKDRDRKLNEMQDAGIDGVKVDFWCSDRQEAMAAMQALFQDAAGRKLEVNLHGCTIPRGWQRTWPNYLSAEAVLGNESYFYEPQYTQKAAELSAVLPFTRNVAGPMDFTPVACSPKKFERTTTAAHELATAIVFTCGIIHYADSPEYFESLPAEALKIFRDAPARWDESRCLMGDPGKAAVFARRHGNSWFIAGLNGSDAVLPVKLDLEEFSGFKHRLLVAEGADAKMRVAVTPVDGSNHWLHEVPPRGGFILRLDQ